MYKDLKKKFWWPSIKRDIAKFVYECLIFQQLKTEHQRPSGLLQSNFIQEWKWDQITMDFVNRFSKSQKGSDTIWVIVDWLTKSAHFLQLCNNTSLDKLAEIYIKEIVRMHVIPTSIISNRNPRFTSRFWKNHFTPAYHQQTDGQFERTIKTIEDMLWACIMDFGGN